MIARAALALTLFAAAPALAADGARYADARVAQTQEQLNRARQTGDAAAIAEAKARADAARAVAWGQRHPAPQPVQFASAPR